MKIMSNTMLFVIIIDFVFKSQKILEKLYKYFIISQFLNNSIMIEDLHPRIKQAAKYFSDHNYKKALQLYQSCTQDLQSTILQEHAAKSAVLSLLLNLYSSKAAIECVLKRYDTALQTVEKGLSKDIYHTALLLRRSQIYKKQNKVEKAIADLQIVSMFSPDNLQLCAMRLELDNILLKCKGRAQNGLENEKFDNSVSDSQIDLDQQAALNFSNLKVIDRISIRLSPNTSNFPYGQSPLKNIKRQSHVTISGDSAFYYEKDQQKQEIQIQTQLNVSIEKALQKYKKIEKQLIESDKVGSDYVDVPLVKCQSLVHGKSILKNRNSQLYIDPSKKVYDQSDRRPSFIERLKQLKNIDGKVIMPQQSGKKQGVGFRKSISFTPNPNICKSLSFNPVSPVAKKNASTSSRKSCLKRSSFECPELFQNMPYNSKSIRKSKFDMLSKMSIDGDLIKHGQDKVNENRENQSHQSDDDGGSSHNIYGSQQQFILSKQIRENFGLDAQSSRKIKEKKLRNDGSKSILRKQSVFSPASSKLKSTQSSITENQVKQTEKKPKLKSKKSVMFKG